MNKNDTEFQLSSMMADLLEHEPVRLFWECYKLRERVKELKKK